MPPVIRRAALALALVFAGCGGGGGSGGEDAGPMTDAGRDDEDGGGCPEGEHDDGEGGCTADPCMPDPCDGEGTECVPQDEGFVCRCAPGTHDEGGECVPDAECTEQEALAEALPGFVDSLLLGDPDRDGRAELPPAISVQATTCPPATTPSVGTTACSSSAAAGRHRSCACARRSRAIA